MTELLTAAGYARTKAQLQRLESRLAEIEQRPGIDPALLASVRQSYKMMMREYLQDIKLYEAHENQLNSASHSK